MRVIGLLLLGLAQVSAVVTGQLNGWYPCAEYTFSSDGTSTDQTAQCAVYSAPLCYPGICDSADSKSSEIDIFVKRLSAVGGSVENATNVWLIQGGPGQPSSKIEYLMLDLHAKLNGTANVYTMDHRGTGRSTILDCVAAQVLTTGSPKGRDIDPTEVAACAKALEFKYPDLAAFSITSAATDLSTFISKYTNGTSTIVYGVSYGTAVVERLMHLDPPEVTGYVMDGIASTSGVSADKFEYFSTYERDYDEVGDRFLRFCARDSACHAHFTKQSLPDTLKALLAQFDNNPNSTCATLVSKKTSSWSNVQPSFKLRETLGQLLSSSKKRSLIAPVVHRMRRCSPDDIEILSNFFDRINEDRDSKPESSAYASNLLYYLIMFSEMWESPSPTAAEMHAQFGSTKLSDGSIYQLAPLYCAFSKDEATWCEELGYGNYEANAIMYERDQYWNKSAAVPNEASVLLLSSKLDPTTPHKYAEYLLDVLEGDNKELITFNYSSHGTVVWSFLVDNDFSSDTCGMKILASYVSNDGDLAKLDKSCLDEMPPLSLTPPTDYQYIYLSTEDAYDGVYNSSLGSLYL